MLKGKCGFYTATSCQPWLQNVSKQAYTITQ